MEEQAGVRHHICWLTAAEMGFVGPLSMVVSIQAAPVGLAQHARHGEYLMCRGIVAGLAEAGYRRRAPMRTASAMAGNGRR